MAKTLAAQVADVKEQRAARIQELQGDDYSWERMREIEASDEIREFDQQLRDLRARQAEDS
jgi:hypothetical protein